MDDAVTPQGRKVAAHWSRLAVTYEGALTALAEAGIDVKAVRPEDLHALDMIHMGGLSATDALAEQAAITPGLCACSTSEQALVDRHVGSQIGTGQR